MITDLVLPECGKCEMTSSRLINTCVSMEFSQEFSLHKAVHAVLQDARAAVTNEYVMPISAIVVNVIIAEFGKCEHCVFLAIAGPASVLYHQPCVQAERWPCDAIK